jgi:RNA polymerase sigma factor (TIGR02999 family)
MSAVTQILQAAAEGDCRASADLLPLVYDELRRLASARLAAEPAGNTLQPTALVHEAYLRLIGDSSPLRWDSRGHFFAAAAEAMRRILVDAARRRRRLKRGGDQVRLNLDEVDVAAPETHEDLLMLDEALDNLAAADAQAAALVKLRYFAGLSLGDVAQAMGISPRTADRLWAYARAWLHQEIRA